MTTRVLHSIVIPIYNEAGGLETLYERLRTLVARLEPDSAEIILVNDGSHDGSYAILESIAARDSRFKVLDLSRNFGHQAAITAGIEWTRGDTVTVMDADLQDPPEVIVEMIARWREGFEVVFAVRRTREGETWFKLLPAKLFYRVLRALTHVDIPVDSGDFRLIDRKAADALIQMRERNRFVRGMVSWVGFRQGRVLYDREERKWGKSHYPLGAMIRFALDGITSFSSVPLRLSLYLGLASSGAGFVYALYILFGKYTNGRVVQGWTSTMLVILFQGGIQLLAIGILGEYIGRTYEEVKHRPLFLVGRALGFERHEHGPRS